ncbi:hypothetical protein [Nevskia sp.]|uniref:hypothetical protein n=1 Tax=Nevskia sp. TaxID=1929292 RepID=UPI0025DC63E5|nr:hypothetical protein [Nevskia sp.]
MSAFPPSPAPAEVAAARAKSGLTQTEAAALVYSTFRTWQNWESGARNMPPALWELWQYKALRVPIPAGLAQGPR